MSADFQVEGQNAAALFTLKAHRGEGMVLLGMNWKAAKPPDELAGFAIEYREPGGDRFFVLKNRLAFPLPDGTIDDKPRPSLQAPFQKFRWVHFPRNAELTGEFLYRVTPVFFADDRGLSHGEPQTVAIELRRDTYPRRLNVAFTRGFVSSQAFVDRFEKNGPVSQLLPATADEGLSFSPTHPDTAEALPWMGFEAVDSILDLLDAAVKDSQAQVMVVAYDLNLPVMLKPLQQLGKRLRVIIDDSGTHGKPESAETTAEKRLVRSAGRAHVKRQHMGGLQHNKMIVVDSPSLRAVVFGSTNFSWRGFYVQANNAVVVRGKKPVEVAKKAFEGYWKNDDVAGFGATPAAQMSPLGLGGIDAAAAFSPHTQQTALLATIAADIADGTKSSLLFSMAFLYQTKGKIREAIKKVTEDDAIFVYGMSEKEVGGIDLQRPNERKLVRPASLSKHVPEPFKSEPSGGGGIRMHHKFAVIDFDKPTARVYTGSYNFSPAADKDNGENLLLLRDQRVAVAYMVEAVRLFDHYEFRLKQQETPRTELKLAGAGGKPWWDEDYTVPLKIRDRELFA